jgi:polyphosphate glucokinase
MGGRKRGAGGNGRANDKRVSSRKGKTTLSIDIGGTGLKALLLDAEGHPTTERHRVPTPRPATPRAVADALLDLVRPLSGYDRVSVGFPGVVIGGVVRSAPNLDGDWKDVRLAEAISERLRRPVRVLNDAGVQGFGVIEGKGLEMVITLGTGMGCALYIDGHYVPNLELAHHPFRGSSTYEDYVGARALERVGRKTWNKRVARVLAQIEPVWNPSCIYLGGGNAKYLKPKLLRHIDMNVRITDNLAGLLGGIALWNERELA